jgi:hypothetical protein
MWLATPLDLTLSRKFPSRPIPLAFGLATKLLMASHSPYSDEFRKRVVESDGQA